MHNRLNFDAIQREINTRLDPDSIAIDGRDLRDRLAFVASIAELIIFYDENNQKAGNWYNLVMKDPIILLAVMSKTDYQAAHMQYAQIQPVLEASKGVLTQFTASSQSEQKLSAESQQQLDKAKISIHQLLRLLDGLFQRINQWASYITDSNNPFTLREYLVQQVPLRLSNLLWQRLSLQQYLATQLPHCLPSTPDFSISDFCDIWTAQASETVPLPNSVLEALQELETIYQSVFGFFVQVVTEAKSAFYQLASQQNDFPDTSLIIACNELLKYSQVGLNQFSRKHLDFYFQKLLHQKQRSVTPDSAYVCLTLAKKTATLNLPAGTEFTAGIYADKTPVIFASDEETEINQIQISSIQSSNYVEVEQDEHENPRNGKQSDQSSEKHNDQQTNVQHNEATPLIKRQQRVQTLPESTVVHRNLKGQVQASDWFGSNQTDSVQQGFVLASPMFYLGSGTRTLVLTFTFDKPVIVEAIKGAQLAMSTSKGWFDIKTTELKKGEDPQKEQSNAPTLATASTSDWKQADKQQNTLTLAITLDKSFPAVGYFKKPPLGYSAEQCYLRVLLPNSINLQTAWRLKTLNIAVQVSGGENFALSNDSALLVNNKPMAIFGSTADVGNHCFVSSPEAFSKPLKTLDLTLTWDNLSDDLSDYYKAYNDYLTAQGQKARYQNDAFKIDWAMETDAGWQTIGAILSNKTPTSETESDMSDSKEDVNSENDAASPKKSWIKRAWHRIKHETEDVVDHLTQHTSMTQPEQGLFAQISSDDKNSPALINAPQSSYRLTFSSEQRFETQAVAEVASNKNPRLRFTLTDPSDAFGNALYGTLVSAITLENAKTLMNGFGLLGPIVKILRGAIHLLGSLSKKLSFLPIIKLIAKKAAVPAQNMGKTKPLPNTPLILKAKEARLQYEAEQHIDFTEATLSLSQDFSLIHIGTPNTYIYFQQKAEAQHSIQTAPPSIDLRSVTLQPQHIGDAKTSAGCAIFQGVCAPAASANISLQAIQAPCRLTLYVELAQDISCDHNHNENAANNDVTVALYYLSKTGWLPVSILSDGTKAFTRSGILSIDIAQDIWLDSAIFTPVLAKPPKQPLLQSQLLLTQAGQRRVATVYCNTQAIKVSRSAPIGLPAGEMPQLAPLSIKQSAQKMPEISAMIQPFGSFGGVPAENNVLFNQRVSQRLKTKDRASNDQDFVTAVKLADATVFYVKRLATTQVGVIKLGLVQGYTNSSTANAFRPVVPRAEQVVIQDYLATRISAMAQISLGNLAHVPLSVKAKLVISEAVNANDLLLALQAAIDLYLSPWIQAPQAQYSLAEGLSKSAFTQFIASFPEVKAVQSLTLKTSSDTVANNSSQDVLFPNDDGSIWVASATHTITFIRATSSASNIAGEQQLPAVSLPENTLMEASL